MEVIKDERPNSNWVTAVVNGRWCQAKVYDVGSCFGINDGRVSKLVIGKTSTRDPSRNFFDQMDYNYDRGLDFSNLDDDFVNDVVRQFEEIEPAFN